MITSASNDKIKEIKKLIKSASRRKETGLYIVEGIRMVREIPADAVKTLYVAESMTDKFADICNQRWKLSGIRFSRVCRIQTRRREFWRRYIRQPQRRMIYLQVMRHRFF